MRKETEAFLTGTIAILLAIIPAYSSASTLTYVADTGNNRIQVFDSTGAFISTWGQFGKDAGNLDSPAAVAVGSRGEYVYVADTGNNRVVKYDSAGNFVAAWGGPVYGTANGQFSSPNSIAVNFENNDDYVYVADTGNNRVQKFDSRGNWVLTMGSTTAGSAPGVFNNPQGVTADNTRNYIYVVDTGNNRIQKCDINGNFITTWGVYGTGNGNFKFPRDIGVDSLGRVYVADCLNYRIERFTQDGSFDAAWGAQGENNGQFEDHYGVSVDQDNNVFVADAGNNRIQKFTPDGVWLATIGSLQQGINPGQFYYPMGVEVYFPQPGVPSFTPTVTCTFTQTSTFTQTYTYTQTYTFTMTSTYTLTFTPTNTFTVTNTNTATSTFTGTSTATSTSTPAVMFTFTPTNTAAGTVAVTSAATPTSEKTPDCGLSYRLERDGRCVTKGEMPDTDKYWNGWTCGGTELKKIADAKRGFVYLFEMGRIKISVYDINGCFADDVQSMIDHRKGRSPECFEGWFVQEGLNKNVSAAMPPETCITKEFDSCSMHELTVPKETPLPYEEMSAGNVYNYPNPCNGHTTIRFSLPQSRETDIAIYDIAGKPVWQTHMDVYSTVPGVNYVQWDGANSAGVEAANGTYVFRVISGGIVIAKKIAIVR